MKQAVRIILVTLFICAISFVQAQQATPKPKAKRKVVAKTGTAQKAKKSSKKDAMVFLCEGSGSGTYTYHSRKTCATLAKCKGKIREVSKSDAKFSYGKEPCKNCN